MGKIYLLILVIIVFIISGCRQDEELKKVELDSYMPTSAGSEWTYSGSYSYTSKITGNVKPINGREFFEIETTSGSSVSYSYIREEEDGSYYSYSKLPGTEDYFELNILNRNSAKGNSWTTTVPYKGQSSKCTFTLDDILENYSANGKEFSNVLKVKMVISVEYKGFDIPVLKGSYFYAKGVGLIHSDIGGTESVIESYSIK
jgi:hypothetical protein